MITLYVDGTLKISFKCKHIGKYIYGRIVCCYFMFATGACLVCVRGLEKGDCARKEY